MNKIDIYTDGGCHGNPGPGAWAWAIYKNGSLYRSNCGYSANTTNNEMELTAISESLRSIDPEVEIINIHSDSTYCINTFTQWITNWISNGSITSRSNSNLIMMIKSQLDSLENIGVDVIFKKVKAHSGIEGNEFVDKLLTDCINSNDKYIPDIISNVNDVYQDITEYVIKNNSIICELPNGSKIRLSKSIVLNMLNSLMSE